MNLNFALVLVFILATIATTLSFVFASLLVVAIYRYKTATETAVEAMAKLAQDIIGLIGKMIARFRLHLNG
jgi:ABC-type spermidine/putrescine transport system permease subunit II